MKTVEKRAADWFRWMGIAGLVITLGFFVLYVTGVVGSEVSPAESAAHWSESSAVYLAETGLVFGPGWFWNFIDGYFLSTAALAILASAALPTLLVLSMFWLQRREFLYGFISLAITLVISAAVIGL